MVVYILQWKGIPTYDIDTYTMLVANSRELRFIIIGSDFKWESITAAWGDRYGVGDVAGEEHNALAWEFYFEQIYFAGFASSLQT